MIVENVFDDSVTHDESLLLRFQAAKVRYENASLYQIEDPELEHEYCDALLALGGLEDPYLLTLAKEAQGGGCQALEAGKKLLDQSFSLRNLFPLDSHRIQ